MSACTDPRVGALGNWRPYRNDEMKFCFLLLLLANALRGRIHGE